MPKRRHHADTLTAGAGFAGFQRHGQRGPPQQALLRGWKALFGERNVQALAGLQDSAAQLIERHNLTDNVTNVAIWV